MLLYVFKYIGFDEVNDKLKEYEIEHSDNNGVHNVKLTVLAVHDCGTLEGYIEKL